MNEVFSSLMKTTKEPSFIRSLNLIYPKLLSNSYLVTTGMKDLKVKPNCNYWDFSTSLQIPNSCFASPPSYRHNIRSEGRCSMFLDNFSFVLAPQRQVSGNGCQWKLLVCCWFYLFLLSKTLQAPTFRPPVSTAHNISVVASHLLLTHHPFNLSLIFLLQSLFNCLFP